MDRITTTIEREWRVRANSADRQYELHIAKILRFSNWDRRRRQPRISAKRRPTMRIWAPPVK